MKLEDQIKDALMRHAEDTRPDATSWDSVESRVRRGHYTRVAMVSTMTVALIAAAVVVLPRLGTETKRNGFAGETPVPTPSSVSIDTSDWNARVGTQGGFQLLIPPDWKGGWFEGYWDYEPKNLPGLPEGGDTFAIEVHVTSGNYRDLAPGDARQSKIGQREALWWQVDARHYRYAISWPDCLKGARDCNTTSADRTLLADVTGSTDALWNQYRLVGMKVVETLLPYDGNVPAHGTVLEGVAHDAYLQALIRFMDARVEGIGAEDQMCCNGATAYDDFGGLYELFQNDLVNYEITPCGSRSYDYVCDVGTGAIMLEATVEYANGMKRVETIKVAYQKDQSSEDELPQVGGAFAQNSDCDVCVSR